jgi:putative tricarboxylic transport membrane protein
MLEHVSEILTSLSNPLNILFLIAGVIVGIIVGALPGLTVTMALALLLPFTFAMQADTALITLGGLYIGGMFGGCISAILINTPGTPSAIATTFDGYPLTKLGKPDQAIATAAIGSGIGGLFGGFVLLFLTPLLASVALKFGPPEYFWIAILGLTMIATLSGGSMLKGLIGGAIGLLISTVGIAPIGGQSRFTFGFPALIGGFELIVVLIAFFCVPEVIGMIENKIQHENKKFKVQKGVASYIFNKIIRKPILLLRSSIIGVIAGIIPGAGGNVAALLSYDAEVRFSKDKSEYGKGKVEGVAAAETANNAEVGGSLVPLLSLGIPGAPPAAIILGALLIQGIQPGPNLFAEHGGLVYTFLWSFIIANVVMLFAGLYGSRYIGRLINLPSYYLAPVILFLTVIGSYAIRNNFFDVMMLIIIGLIAYFTKKFGFNPAPIVLGLILGSITEIGLAQSMLIGQAHGNVLLFFFTRPVSVILIILCILSVFSPLLSDWFNKKVISSPKQEKGEEHA